ncbi:MULTISPECIES: PTS transporter subunit EIIC [unclassified Clostridioides]|uniref:PTS transporter subunit EIIC n=1 Tax=unclassified Clostridioides TaxID=2635829 RepID=UPI001D11D456|nr:PTS transporter subunit EIIC [Clostridioides sp. ES-S-0171-01]UDN55184.1 PTS transporter subunit EIIC [Clostridioides sp. ES-S-0054-01]
MDYSILAENIISLVGGKENINTVNHCMTRLRIVLEDLDKVKTEEIKSQKDVLGVAISGGQYQIIIGPEVKKVYAEITSKLSIPNQEKIQIKKEKEKTSIFNQFFKAISGIIHPVLGVMTAAGITKGILAGLTSFGIIGTDSGTYQILFAFADGFYYFLPIILGFSAAKKLGSNPYIGVTIGAALVYPAIVTAYNDGFALSFLNIPVVLTSYGNSVFPVLIATYVASIIELKIKDKIYTAITAFITPLITLIVVVPLTFLVIGPIATMLSDILASSTQNIYAFSPIVTGVILGAFWQVIVIFGLHYAFIPILMNNVATLGKDPINAILNVTVFALAGAAIGFGLRTKNKDERALGLSTGVIGLLGVTEPIIYGIALPNKNVFVLAFIGGGLAGAITASMNAHMFSFGGNALFAAPMFINPQGIDSNFTAYIIASIVAFFVPLALSYLFGVKKLVKELA